MHLHNFLRRQIGPVCKNCSGNAPCLLFGSSSLSKTMDRRLPNRIQVHRKLQQQKGIHCSSYKNSFSRCSQAWHESDLRNSSQMPFMEAQEKNGNYAPMGYADFLETLSAFIA